MVTASKQIEVFARNQKMKGRGLGGNLRFPPMTSLL